MTQADREPRRTDRYHVAILGAGIAGSMLAAVLARNGVRVLLVDAATHPRFAVGESTIPTTSAMIRIISERYRVPEIAPLASFAGIRDHVSRNCGRKQNFGFVYHREGGWQDPRETNQFTIPKLLRTAGAPGKQVPRNGRLEGMAKSVPGCFKGGEPSVRPKRGQANPFG